MCSVWVSYRYNRCSKYAKAYLSYAACVCVGIRERKRDKGRANSRSSDKPKRANARKLKTCFIVLLPLPVLIYQMHMCMLLVAVACWAFNGGGRQPVSHLQQACKLHTAIDGRGKRFVSFGISNFFLCQWKFVIHQYQSEHVIEYNKTCPSTQHIWANIDFHIAFRWLRQIDQNLFVYHFQLLFVNAKTTTIRSSYSSLSQSCALVFCLLQYRWAQHAASEWIWFTQFRWYDDRIINTTVGCADMSRQLDQLEWALRRCDRRCRR